MKDTGDVNSVQPEKKRLTLFGVEVVYLYLLGIFLAGLGWIAENVVQLITHGIISSKFHILPFISAYALIVFAVQIFLGDPDDIAIFGKHIFKLGHFLAENKGCAVYYLTDFCVNFGLQHLVLRFQISKLHIISPLSSRIRQRDTFCRIFRKPNYL